MTDIEQLAERHIREHESRLKHVDELLEEAGRGAVRAKAPSEISTRLTELRHERDRLAQWLDGLRSKPKSSWQEKEMATAGPMGVWDALAQQIERLVERLER